MPILFTGVTGKDIENATDDMWEEVDAGVLHHLQYYHNTHLLLLTILIASWLYTDVLRKHRMREI